MKNKKIFRHGDILLFEVGSIQESAKLEDTRIIDEGEATGHFHQFKTGNVKVMIQADKKYIEVLTPSPLSHEEHKTVVVEPGKYEVVKEREWDYFSQELRLVQD